MKGIKATMEKESIKEKFKGLDYEIKDVVLYKGEFETENGRKIPWKNYRIKMKIGNYIVAMKVDKAFTEIFDEILKENE